MEPKNKLLYNITLTLLIGFSIVAIIIITCMIGILGALIHLIMSPWGFIFICGLILAIIIFIPICVYGGTIFIGTIKQLIDLRNNRINKPMLYMDIVVMTATIITALIVGGILGYTYSQHG